MISWKSKHNFAIRDYLRNRCGPHTKPGPDQCSESRPEERRLATRGGKETIRPQPSRLCAEGRPLLSENYLGRASLPRSRPSALRVGQRDETARSDTGSRGPGRQPKPLTADPHAATHLRRGHGCFAANRACRRLGQPSTIGLPARPAGQRRRSGSAELAKNFTAHLTNT